MAISLASSETNGKNVYGEITSRNRTSTGHTQAHGDPAGVYVNGCVHVTVVQSSLGGGGGSAKTEVGGSAAVFVNEELDGDIVGLPNRVVGSTGDGAGADGPWAM